MSTCAIRARYAIATVVETVKWKRDKKLILWTKFCYYSSERARALVCHYRGYDSDFMFCTSRTACELCGPIKIYKIHRIIHFVVSLLTAWVSWVHFYFAQLIAASWQPSSCCRIREIRISSASDVMCVFALCARHVWCIDILFASSFCIQSSNTSGDRQSCRVCTDDRCTDK